MAEQKLKGAAALASRRAAEVFGLEVLQEAVQDFEYNITRFAIIGGVAAADANKTTIVFALPSTPGALFKALSVFALRDINLTKLESRPMRGRPWEYLFYVEVDARRDDLGVRARADAPRRVREVDAHPGELQGCGEENCHLVNSQLPRTQLPIVPGSRFRVPLGVELEFGS